MIFGPGGNLIADLRQHSTEWVHEYQYAMTRYTNLLHLRHHALEPFILEFETRIAPSVMNYEACNVQHSYKVSVSAHCIWQGQLRLSRPTTTTLHNEVLAVLSVSRPIISGRDCMLLTTDGHLFEQVFRFTSCSTTITALSSWRTEDFDQNPFGCCPPPS